ncbi:MAG: hypothetical protein KDI55_25190 [Anaerolineae bacterium]|nr:hypothetical protein [Anaerolineae bacterium]
MTIPTNVQDFMGELGAGVFENKLAHTLSEVAAGTVTHGDRATKGKVVIEITMTPVGDHDQLVLSHKLSMTVPTRRGKRSEEDTTETPMFVGKGGMMTATPPREEASGQFTLAESKPAR